MVIQRIGLYTAIALMAAAPLAEALAEGYMQRGFGRFGRFNDDGLLTVDVWPDRAAVSSLSVRFAPTEAVPSVTSIDTTAKSLRLAGVSATDASVVHYTLLYPGLNIGTPTSSQAAPGVPTV